MKHFLCIVLLLFVCAGKAILGQHVEVVYKHYNVENGLAGSTVYTAYQDSKGFIWLGTNQGVCCFDGKNFTTYTTKDGLPDNEVFIVYEDEYERIWFTCFNAYPCFLYRGKIYNYNNSSLLRQIKEKDYSYTSVLPDTGKTFWLTAAECAYHIKKDTIIRYPADIWERGTLCLKKLNNEYLLFTPSHLYKLVSDSFVTKQEIHSFEESTWGFRALCFHHDTLYATKEKSIRVGKNSINVYTYNDTLKMLWSANINDKVYNIYRLKNNEVLCTTEKGIRKLDFEKRQLIHDSLFNILKDEQVGMVLEDKEQNLWFPTLSNGVFMIPYKKVFRYNESSTTQVNAIFVQDSLCYVARNDASVEVYNANKLIKTLNFYPHMEKSSRVIRIKKYKNTHLLFATDRGIVAYNIKTGELAYGLQSNIKSIDVRGDSIFFGAATGIAKYEINSNKVDNVYWDNIRATALQSVGDSGFMYGTLTGLKCHNCLLPNFGKYDSILKVSRIIDIEETDSKLWIATATSGVFVIRNGITVHIGEESGLSNNLCKRLIIDDDKRIWVCTPTGLNLIQPDSKQPYHHTVTVYNKRTGLLYDDINDVSISKNVAYIGTAKGVFRFDIKQKNTIVNMPAYITMLSISDSSVDFTKKIITTYKNNNIGISYIGISFLSGNVYYKYILDGADNDTVFTDLERVNFSSLAPGKYVFYVWAQNPDGQWSHKPASVSIQVKPPFWQTWWFRFTVFAVVIGGIILYFRRRISRLEKEQNLLRRIDELELMALKSQMNPHFVFNSLNSIQSFVNKNDSDTANRYLSSFGKLIRQTLDFSSKQDVSVEDEAGYLKTYLGLEKMRFSDKFDYFITIDESYPGIKQLEIPSLILQPYVENAIRHGLRYKEDGHGILNINFYVKENVLYCEVDDNGIGRVKARELKSLRHVEYQSKGMDLSGNRVDAINRLNSSGIKLNIIDKIENGIAIGTLIQLLIPLQGTYDNSNNS